MEIANAYHQRMNQSGAGQVSSAGTLPKVHQPLHVIYLCMLFTSACYLSLHVSMVPSNVTLRQQLQPQPAADI